MGSNTTRKVLGVCVRELRCNIFLVCFAVCDLFRGVRVASMGDMMVRGCVVRVIGSACVRAVCVTRAQCMRVSCVCERALASIIIIGHSMYGTLYGWYH